MGLRTYKTLDEWRPSPRVAIRPGDLVRFPSGGPIYQHDDGTVSRAALRGTFLVERVIKDSTRTYLEVITHVDGQRGAIRLVCVAGRCQRSKFIPNAVNQPYKVKRVTGRVAR